MATDRQATNVWQGDLQSGSGQTSLDTSGAAGLLAVSWPSRAEDSGGRTSPEELIAAAHASCFNMSLSLTLSEGGNPPERLETSAVVTFTTEGGAHVSKVALTTRGTVPGISEDDFRQAAEGAKDGCPVSKLIAGNTELAVDASLA